MPYLLTLSLLLSVFVQTLAQAPSGKRTIQSGTWRATLLLDKKNNILLPFQMEIFNEAGKVVIFIRNGEERIQVDEITKSADSLCFKMPVFDSEFRAKNYGDSLQGLWLNHSRKSENILPFKAYFNQRDRFVFKKNTQKVVPFGGRWKTQFSPGSKDSSNAIGVFTQHSNQVNGTFLTETGDYRYLAGSQHDSVLYLSCFDGSHAFLFIGKLSNKQQLQGDFYSGAHWREKWVAEKNDSFKLKDPEHITYLKEGLDKISFSYPDLRNQMISTTDKRFMNKVLIIQVMGSWCPNCMDETVYLSSLYEKYKDKGLEIIALAYEKTSDTSKARKNVLRLKTKYRAAYTFLLTGLSGKDKATESLPALNAITAFPTTIYVDKKGKVRKIYTGFSGPATGNEYLKFTEANENLITNLLKE